MVADDAIADVDILAVAFENQVWVCRAVLCSVDITLLLISFSSLLITFSCCRFDRYCVVLLIIRGKLKFSL